MKEIRLSLKSIQKLFEILRYKEVSNQTGTNHNSPLEFDKIFAFQNPLTENDNYDYFITELRQNSNHQTT